MNPATFYLLKLGITESLDVEEGEYPTTYGLFDLTDARHPKPIVKPNNAEPNTYYSTASDLAVATAAYFKEKFGPINSIDATEMLEAVNFPMRPPIVEFLPDTNCAVYSRFRFAEYTGFMKELTKQLDGKK